MSALGNRRTLGGVALSILVFAGLPGLAIAAQPVVGPATSNPHITGLVKNSGGVGVAGIAIQAIGTGTNSQGTTGSDGSYSITVAPSDTYVLVFNDPGLVYLNGDYDTSKTGNFSVGGYTDTGIVVGGSGAVVASDVTLTVGYHITGKVTGPATPGNPLEGVAVNTDAAGVYTTYSKTAADGTYSLTVPTGAFRVEFSQGQGLYQTGCYWDGVFSTDIGGNCVGAVNVGPSGVTGVSVHMPLEEGDTLVVSPATGTVPAWSSQAYTATLANLGPQVQRAGKGGPVIDLSNVTSVVTFTISGGGTCTGASCTPPAIGDYTITATYAGITGTAGLSATTAVATPTPDPTEAPTATPTAGPTAAVTPPPTSTGGPGQSGEGALLATILFGFAAAASLTVALRRRVISQR